MNWCHVHVQHITMWCEDKASCAEWGAMKISLIHRKGAPAAPLGPSWKYKRPKCAAPWNSLLIDTELATIRLLPEESDFTFTTKQLVEEEEKKEHGSRTGQPIKGRDSILRHGTTTNRERLDRCREVETDKKAKPWEFGCRPIVHAAITSRHGSPAAICSLPPEAGHADRPCCPHLKSWSAAMPAAARVCGTTWQCCGQQYLLDPSSAPPIGGPCLPTCVELEPPSSHELWMQLLDVRVPSFVSQWFGNSIFSTAGQRVCSKRNIFYSFRSKLYRLF